MSKDAKNLLSFIEEEAEIYQESHRNKNISLLAGDQRKGWRYS